MNETGEFSSLLRLDAPSEGGGVAFLLTVIDGPDRGAALLVDPSLPSRAFVGTSTSCELRVKDGDVARRHLAVEVGGGDRLRITDLETTHGTTADGIAVVDAYLSGGETVRIGATAIRVERADALPASKKSSAERFGRVVGASPEMRRLYPLCQRFASVSAAVLIEGEPGTGKEVLAEAIHEHGPRAQRPFVVLDCASIAPANERAEIFGEHGALARARGGTLVVDEIGDLDAAVQAELARFFDESPGHARLLSTTRRDLDRAIEAGHFREDHFDRISEARLELPPLRRRTGDVRRLALHFAREIGGPAATLPPELLARWELDAWPGNVRGLREAVAHWLALDDLALDTHRSTTSDAFFDELLAHHLPLLHARDRVVADLVRRQAERVLAEHDGNVASAADASGIARRHFARGRLSSPHE